MPISLECPVCLDINYDTKYYVCLNGHNICADCLPQMSNVCPVCRAGYNSPATRNLVIEELIAEHEAARVLACLNEHSGCSFSGVAELKLLHEQEECMFHRVHCPFAACKADLTLNDLEAHLRAKREDVKHIQSASGSFQDIALFGLEFFETGMAWLPMLVTHDGLQFYTCESIQVNSQLLSLHLEVNATEVVAKSLKSKDGLSKMKWLCPVHSVLRDPDDILADKSCLKVSQQMVNGLLTEEHVSEPCKSQGFTHSLCIEWEIVRTREQ